MSTAIEAEGLTRKFGSFTAVDRISLAVEEGTIFGLLGANGAGKSTTIRMLCGLLSSTAGEGYVAGYSINREPEAIKQNIGYMSQEFSLYRDLTVEENITFFGGVYGLSPQRIRERKQWVLEMAGLRGRESMLADQLSGGWRQRLALGCAVLHEPRIIFLDEPTGGVDPVSRREFWDLINSFADEGVTVLVTTHYLDEAEYCNEVSLMHAGRIAAQGSPSALKRGEIPYRIWQVSCDEVTDALALLQEQEWVRESSIFGRAIHVGADLPEEEAAGKIRRLLEEGGIELRRVDSILPSLEDVFIHVISRESRNGGGGGGGR
jgi:ABC-2 type transport system ATP-binding protein